MRLDFTGRTAAFVGGPGPLGMALADRLRAGGAVVFADADAAASALAATGRLDILVIDAETGLAAGPPTLAQRWAAASVGVERAARAFDLALPPMRAARYGRALAIAPAAGMFGLAADPAGAARAAALHALARSLAAASVEGDICINTLSPLIAASMHRAFLDAVPTLDPGAFDAEGPLALASFLCHETCARTGESFSAGAGRLARIFQAAGPGLFEPGLGEGEVGARLAEIMDLEGYIVPRDAPDELVLVAV
jgi:NAD(P)-dependent dehydrogenase (short-subunit alcohol dehydrogenase family)